MIEPMRTMSNRDADLANYQPLAVMAVVAFVVSSLFVALVVVLTLVGLFTRKPVLEAWLIAAAIIGVLLSIAAKWQIRISEGTRAGQKLSNWALWLSLMGGLIYLAYYAGSVMSIQAQANTFVNDVWLKAIKEKDFENAFLFTREPRERVGMNMKDIAARFGDITGPIHSNSLVRIIEKADGKVEIERRGTIRWQATPEGYEITTQVLVRTPEGDFDVIIPAIGSDQKGMQGRQWQIKLQRVGLRPLGISKYGRLMSNLEFDSKEFLSDWTNSKLLPFRRPEAYLDTVAAPRDERRKRYHIFLVQGIVSNWLNSVTEPARGLSVAAAFGANLCISPNYGEVYFPNMNKTTRGLVQWDESKQQQDKSYKEKQAEQILGIGAIQLADAENTAAPRIDVTEKEIRASMEIKINLPAVDAVPSYRCKGRVFATLDDPKLASELFKMKNEPWNGQAQLEPASATKPMMTKYPWRISAVVIDLARDMTDERPGGRVPSMTAPPK
jgi:hypothetical protein